MNAESSAARRPDSEGAVMRYFIVYAHPEPRSFNGHLLSQGVAALERAGHEVEVSNLHAMRWKAVADALDFPARDVAEPLNYSFASLHAYLTGTQSPDIVEEQRKLLWADAIVLQFPLWWHGPPAILKGWIDRVLTLGFVHGLTPDDCSTWGRCYEDGALKGRRAMVASTVGERAARYGPGGVHGPIDDLLWPLQYGTLFYAGLQVVPPTLFYDAGAVTAGTADGLALHYAQRLLTIADVPPIPFPSPGSAEADSPS